MCIMAQPVKSVTATHIYAAPNAEHTRQVTVYEMAVALSGQGNAMILPVPSRAEDITLMDLSNLRKWFEFLAEVFQPRKMSFTKGVSRGFLRVQRVGDYDVSIAEGIGDLDRVNPDVFTLSARTADVLGEHYGLDGFSFIVAQLRESGRIHPLGYTHTLAEEALFIPTRHEHGDGGRLPRWDHMIYFQGAPRGQANLLERPKRVDVQRRGALGPGVAAVARGLRVEHPELRAFYHPDRTLNRVNIGGPRTEP